MFRIILILHTKMWKCIVTQRNSLHNYFCGPYSKYHDARGLSKNYHFSFYPKLGNGVCAIIRIPCACVACTSMLDEPWISCIQSKIQERYKPATNSTYWPILGPFNNWKIILLSQKSTPFDSFYEIQQVFLDVISENMASLVHCGKYGSINTTDTSTNGFYVIMFTLEAYIYCKITQQLIDKLSLLEN